MLTLKEGDRNQLHVALIRADINRVFEEEGVPTHVDTP